MNTSKVGQLFYSRSPLDVLPANKMKGEVTSSSFPEKGLSFAQILDKSMRTEFLKFSHHAQNRLSERGIDLSLEQIERLEKGLQKAKGKGAQESLFIMEDLAFVVSVKNKTVITAMGKEQMSEQVITNIDSAVLV